MTCDNYQWTPLTWPAPDTEREEQRDTLQAECEAAHQKLREAEEEKQVGYERLKGAQAECEEWRRLVRDYKLAHQHKVTVKLSREALFAHYAKVQEGGE